MQIATQTAENLFPAVRRAGWRKWMVVLALVCTVGVYSIELTHHHQNLASELGCPICHVMAHGAPNLLKPNISPVFSQLSWFAHLLPARATGMLYRPFAVKPQTRAPPISTSSLI